MAHVLYIEDERWQAVSAIAVLESEYGHSVCLCNTIEEAHRTLREQAFDVVVADIMMSDNGPIRYADSVFVVLERLKANAYSQSGNHRSVPIVFATGVSDMEMIWSDGQRIQVLHAIDKIGVSREDCLLKPFSVETLHNTISRVVTRRLGDEHES
jgi:CheY-like chemotaxis protein